VSHDILTAVHEEGRNIIIIWFLRLFYLLLMIFRFFGKEDGPMGAEETQLSMAGVTLRSQDVVSSSVLVCHLQNERNRIVCPAVRIHQT